MNIILEDSIDYKFKIKDFGIDPVNTRIIVTGDNLVFLNKNKIEKEIKGKLKNCQMIKYIKEKNQLFASSSFFVSTSTGVVYKCDSLKKKIVSTIFDLSKTVEFINFTTSGKIVYIDNNKLFTYDTYTKDLKSIRIENNDNNGNYKIFISEENIILKYRKLHEEENTDRDIPACIIINKTISPKKTQLSRPRILQADSAIHYSFTKLKEEYPSYLILTKLSTVSTASRGQCFQLSF